MAVVNVTNVIVGNNPAPMRSPFEFEIHFESLEPLQEDIEWKLIYVGDVNNKEESDQELDCIALGPIQRGVMKFSLVTDPPNFRKIPYDEIPGITVVLLTGSYRSQEFVRIGYFVHNVITDPELQLECLEESEVPLDMLLDKMQRVILADEPRITRFNIDWDRPNPELLLPCELVEAEVARSSTEQRCAETASQPQLPSGAGSKNIEDHDMVQERFLTSNWAGSGVVFDSVSSTAAPLTPEMSNICESAQEFRNPFSAAAMIK